MDNLEEIYARLRENETITKKFYSVESKILSILNFKDFLEKLLTSIRDTFNVPYVWITLIKNTEVEELMKTMSMSDAIKERTNLIDRDYFIHLIDNEVTPLLANTDLKPFYKLLPPNQKYLIKSIAIAPITLDGEIIGSLNQGDISAERYAPQIDTSELEQLAIKVSLCLSNVTAHEKLKYFAYHDPLTELLNRRVMEKILHREFIRAQRYQKTLSVVFMDIDNFKTINDSYGHDIGDDVLKYLAKSLIAGTRDTDVVSRFAGDEFVIILPETPAEKAALLIHRLQEKLSMTPYTKGVLKFTISISTGISSTSEPLIDHPETLLKMADNRLYELKKLKKKKLSHD